MHEALAMKPRTRRAGEAAAKRLPPTKEVIAVDKIAFNGNLVPHAWYQHLKTERGLTDAIGCLILAEIVYWYRSGSMTEGGKEIRYRRFSGDMLQKGYEELEEKFGFTKDQLVDALIRLERNGLIKRHLLVISKNGRRIPNVVYIQIFPDRVREITTAADAAGVSPEETGYQEKSGGIPSSDDRYLPRQEGVSPAESGDIYLEYPKDYDTDYPKDRVSNSTTTSSRNPGKPASAEVSLSKGEEEQGLSEPGDGVDKPGDQDVSADGVKTSPARSPVLDEHDLAGIRRSLETAFEGQSLTGHSEQKLREYVDDGRITRSFAEALALARTFFERDRVGFKAKKFFIPVQPSYLFKSYDLTVKGILGVLGECYASLQAREEALSFDQDKLQEAQHSLDRYDAYFRKNGCLEPGYELSGGAFSPMRDGVLGIFCNATQYPGWQQGDVIPPAWMKILYAHRNQIYSLQEIRTALLNRAQEEIHNDPRCLKLEAVNLTDEQIKDIFDVNHAAAVEKHQRECATLDRQMERWENLIAAVQDCQAAAMAPLVAPYQPPL
jgi:hypothetical protein